MSTAILLLATTLAVSLPDGPAIRLEPVAPSRFHVVPDEPTALEWKGPADAAREYLDYVVRDYGGAEEARGKAAATPTGFQIDRAFPAGYHEIEFPATSQRFGVIALPRAEGPPDPFFAIDGAMTWLVADDSTRDQLIAAARSLGLAMVRERLGWGAIEPERGRWEWDAGPRFDRLRESYRRAGIPILEIAHDAPAWAGRIGKYPRDLVATADSWSAIGRHWDRAWGGVELWNEPDISFGGDMPGDQYAAFAKAAAFGLRRAGGRAPIVGGVTAYHTPEFLAACVGSGLLERIDVFSFHDYGPAPAFEDLHARYREWLRESGRGDMPLWVTECGWPWKRGPERPPLDQDQASAAQIVLKAVEARACGAARFFAFVYPFYEENASNFGLTDRSATPLRGLAAYAQAIGALRGLSYLGDLRVDDPRIDGARVFGDATRAVEVLGSSARAEAFRPGAAPIRVEGADGRILPVRDGGFDLADGLAYAWFDRPAIAPMLETRTRAMDLHPRAEPKTVAEASPVVLRSRIDPEVVTPTSLGYLLKPGVAGFPVQVEVVNLGDEAETLDVTLAVERAGMTTERDPRRVQVGPRSTVLAEWSVDLRGSFADFRPARLFATARGAKGPLDRLALTLHGEPTLEEALAVPGRKVRLPIGELDRWTSNIAGGGRMEMRSAGPAGWGLAVRHEPGSDRWAYPYFRLPEGVDLADARGLIVRARCRAKGDVRVFLWEGESGVGYINAAGLIPADGAWHVVRLDFDALHPSTANAPDPDGRLDRGSVRKISVGLNSGEDVNDLEVGDAYVAW